MEHECPLCGRLWPSYRAAVVCCDDEHEEHL